MRPSPTTSHLPSSAKLMMAPRESETPGLGLGLGLGADRNAVNGR